MLVLSQSSKNIMPVKSTKLYKKGGSILL